MPRYDSGPALPPDLHRSLHRRSDAKGVRRLLGHLGLICVTGTWIGVQAPFWGLLLVPHGVLLVFLFTLEHECTHRTPFASDWLNEGVGRLCGVILCLPFLWFRYFHFAHHKFTNDPDRDPELASPKPGTWGQYLLYLSGVTVWRSQLLTLWQGVSGRLEASYLPPRVAPRLRREARWMALAYVVALASLMVTPLLFWIWILPLILGQPVLRLYLLAEHGLCPPVANMLENTRTTLTHRAVRWLAWNMPYHIEHHSHPMVPFHALPRLHGFMAPHLVSVSDGYRAFHRDYQGALDQTSG